MIIYSESRETGKVDTYIQLYKNGIIEAVESSFLEITTNNEKIIPFVAYEEELIKSTKQYVEFLQEVNVESPYLIYITLTGVKGYEIKGGRSFFGSGHRIDREILSPEVVIWEDSNIEIDTLLRPIFDSIWNACGYTQSISYDENGRFKPRV